MSITAISLWQPWASALACGTKRNETRSWKAPRYLIGKDIAIHAAKQWKTDEREWAETLQRHGFDLGFRGTPPLGGIVGVARLVGVVPTESLYGRDFEPWPDWNDPRQVEYQLGNYGPGRFAWLFEDPRPVKFVPCRGQQGLWTLDVLTLAALGGQGVVRG